MYSSDNLSFALYLWELVWEYLIIICFSLDPFISSNKAQGSIYDLGPLPLHYPTWVFTKILIILLLNWVTKLYYLHKKAQIHLPCGQNPKSPIRPFYKARCYTTLLQNPLLYGTSKARYYTALLQNSLLHGTLTKPIVTWHSY